MQRGVALIYSDTWLRLQTCCVESQSISDTERPSANNHLKNFCDWDQRSCMSASITKPGPVKQSALLLLIGVRLCRCRLFVLIRHVWRNTRSNFLCHYIFIIVILWQIAFLQFSKSWPCWLIQFLLQLIIGVVQIALCQHSSNRNQGEFASRQQWNGRSHVSIHVVHREKTFQLIVTCSCAY